MSPCESGTPDAPSADALVLDIDPDLGSRIAPTDWADARRACRGTLLHARPGLFDPRSGQPVADAPFALAVIDGLLCREIWLADHHLLELLGPGDVLQLPAMAGPPEIVGTPTLSALGDVRVLALAGSYFQAASRWPVLLASLLERLEIQRARLAVQALISHLPRAEDRLLLTLQHLAGKWGRVTADGTVLSLALTHRTLAHLTSSRRSTVTLAAGALADQGCVRRLSDQSWLLTPLAQHKLDALTQTTAAARAVAETLRLDPQRALDRPHSNGHMSLAAQPAG